MYYFNPNYLFPSQLQPNIYYPVTYQYIPFSPFEQPSGPILLSSQVPIQQTKVSTQQETEIKVSQNRYSQKKLKNLENVQKIVQNNDQPRVLNIRNHNVLPNNINMILSCIRRIKKSGHLVQKIIERLNYNKLYNLKRFYSYQHYLKQNCTDFVNNEAIKAIINCQDPNCSSFSLDQQRFYNKVTRILISTYYHKIAVLDVLGEGRIKKSSIKDHLMIHRYIQSILKGPRGEKLIIKHL